MNSSTDQLEPASRPVTSYQDRTDEELLLDYREHEEPQAFEQLVHRYERELFNYLRHYLGDAQMAEDAFQATFLQVHLKCDQFEAGRRVRPWLYTVATHQAIDAQRRNRRHRMVSLDRCLSGGSNEGAANLEALLDNGDRDPVAQLQADESAESVRQAVAQLPDPLRQVIALVYYQGMKYREAAEILAIPVGTVKSRLHSAIRKLNEVLVSMQVSANE